MSVAPAVSIVTPFLNVRPFLAEAVDSVLAQTYDGWELLLVDDGATDGSTDIARGYAARHPTHIRYLDHPGHGSRGASAARNLALRHARGEYVAFLDGDDVWLPPKLAEQLPILEAQPGVGMMYGNTEYWYSWTGRPEDAALDRLPELGVSTPVVLPPPELLTRILRRSAAVPCTCSVLARHELVRRVGGFEEAFRKIFTDQVFYAKMLIAAPVLVVDRCWDRYRRRAGSSVAAARAAGAEPLGRLRFLEWLDAYVTAQRVGDLALARALRVAVWQARHPRLAGLARRLSRYAGPVRRP